MTSIRDHWDFGLLPVYLGSAFFGFLGAILVSDFIDAPFVFLAISGIAVALLAVFVWGRWMDHAEEVRRLKRRIDSLEEASKSDTPTQTRSVSSDSATRAPHPRKPPRPSTSSAIDMDKQARWIKPEP